MLFIVRLSRRIVSAANFLIAESRPAVQLAFLLRFSATAAIPPGASSRATLAVIGWLHINSAIYVLNGLSDMNGDRLNGSTRPLASGVLHPANARTAIVVEVVVGVGICFIISCPIGVLALVFLLLGVGYSYGPGWKSGRRSAALVIGGGAGLTYIAGASVAGPPPWEVVVYVSTLSLWTAAASGSKDFSDVTGDQLSGRRTSPVELGTIEASRRLIMTTSLTAMLVVATSIFLREHTLSTTAVASGTAIMAASLRTPRSGPSPSGMRTPYRIYMATQYATCAGLLAGRVG